MCAGVIVVVLVIVCCIHHAIRRSRVAPARHVAPAGHVPVVIPVAPARRIQDMNHDIDRINHHIHLGMVTLEDIEAIIQKCGAANVAAWRWHGATLLHSCMKMSDPRVLEALIRAQVDVTVATPGGHTALHLAKTSEAVRILTDAGASLGARNWMGNTPLHEAVLNGCVEAARAMLNVDDCVRHVLVKNGNGRTARDIIILFRFKELAPLLEEIDEIMQKAKVSVFNSSVSCFVTYSPRQLQTSSKQIQ